MTGPALVILAYAVVLAIPAAILAWPLVERAGRLQHTTAILVAGMCWVGLVLPPVVGLAIDRARAPGRCDPCEECADYILWWFGIPVGWLLGGLVVLVAVALGRFRGSRLPS